jgi:hypothetical protein
VANGLGLIIGSGVRVAGVSQALDPLLARRLLAAGTSLGESGTYGKQLEAISAVTSSLDDPSLSTALGAFFDAAGAFARNRGDAGAPDAARARGRAGERAPPAQRRARRRAARRGRSLRHRHRARRGRRRAHRGAQSGITV